MHVSKSTDEINIIIIIINVSFLFSQSINQNAFIIAPCLK